MKNDNKTKGNVTKQQYEKIEITLRSKQPSKYFTNINNEFHDKDIFIIMHFFPVLIKSDTQLIYPLLIFIHLLCLCGVVK